MGVEAVAGGDERVRGDGGERETERKLGSIVNRQTPVEKN